MDTSGESSKVAVTLTEQDIPGAVFGKIHCSRAEVVAFVYRNLSTCINKENTTYYIKVNLLICNMLKVIHEIK